MFKSSCENVSIFLLKKKWASIFTCWRSVRLDTQSYNFSNSVQGCFDVLHVIYIKKNILTLTLAISKGKFAVVTPSIKKYLPTVT